LKGRRIILGVDRLDYTKGLLLKLEAYRRLLENWPHWRTEAVLVQIANPTREEIAPYRRLKEQVEQSVGQINGAYETEGRVPIHYLYRSFSPEALAAYYQMADVAMVTPLRDGMNLVAKEYVACQTSDSGVLILSEFAGAASEMGEAIRVNPWNIEACAGALDTALNMDPQERARRMQLLRRRVEASDVRKWVARFRRALEMTEPTLGGAEAASDNSGNWRRECVAAFRRAGRSLLLLDYDGTLVELQSRPERASPPDETRDLLRRLAAAASVEVAVVSGRDRRTLKEWLGELPISLVAEHGYAFRQRGRSHWNHLIENADFSWMDSVHEVLADYAARTSGAWVENKPSSLAWHYREVEPGFGNWQARELANHISEAFQQSPIEVLHGSKVVEVRHQGIGKGAAVRALLQQFGPCDYILVAGDDRTDEEMFQAAPPQAWTVKIGQGRSRARYRMESAGQLRRLLTHLASKTDDIVPEYRSGESGAS
ncbi:MAG: trehalose-phosphatase, partial [Acidobacteriota bacterium]